jgi:hypothetical protein
MGEMLDCQRNRGNAKDRYAIKKDELELLGSFLKKFPRCAPCSFDKEAG